MPRVVRHTFITFDLFTTTNTRHKILATPVTAVTTKFQVNDDLDSVKRIYLV